MLMICSAFCGRSHASPRALGVLGVRAADTLTKPCGLDYGLFEALRFR